MFKCGVAYKAQTQNKQGQRKKGSKELFEEREIVKSLALQLKGAATGSAVATQSSGEHGGPEGMCGLMAITSNFCVPDKHTAQELRITTKLMLLKKLL